MHLIIAGSHLAQPKALGDRTNGNASRYLGMAAHNHPQQQRPSKYPHLAPDAVTSGARAQAVAATASAKAQLQVGVNSRKGVCKLEKGLSWV